jgi:outer membrane biosynthesis protein TonB
MSGAEWPLTLSDMLLTLAILMLLSEVIKGARPGAKYLTDHLLSLIVFGGAAAEFVLWPKFGTSTYFLLTMLALVDFLSGVALRARRGTLVTPGPVPAPVSTKGARAPGAVAAETRFVPEPAPSVPAAAAVAESVLLDRPQPKIQRPETPKPEVRPNAPPPEIVRAPSPGVVTARSPEVVHTPSPEPANAPSPEPADAPSPEPVDEPSPEVANAPSPEVASPDLQPESSLPPSPKEPPH